MTTDQSYFTLAGITAGPLVFAVTYACTRRAIRAWRRHTR